MKLLLMIIVSHVTRLNLGLKYLVILDSIKELLNTGKRMMGTGAPG